MMQFLHDAMHAQRRMNNNNNKRKRSPPRHEPKRVDIEIAPQPEKVVNGKIEGAFFCFLYFLRKITG